MNIPEKEIYSYLNEKWPRKIAICPVCRSTELSVTDKIFELREYKPEKNKSAVIPVISILCEECGYMLLFNYKTIREYIDEKSKDEKELETSPEKHGHEIQEPLIPVSDLIEEEGEK